MNLARRHLAPRSHSLFEGMRTDAPLFLAACAMALGIALEPLFWIRPALLFTGALAMAFVALLAAIKARRVAWLPTLLLWYLVGAWAAVLEVEPAPDAQIAPLANNLLRNYEGYVVATGPINNPSDQPEEPLTEPDHEPEARSSALRSQPTERVDIELTRIEVIDDDHDAMQPIHGRIRLMLHWPAEAHPSPIPCGSQLSATGQLTEPTVYRDPGPWNRERYLFEQGVSATALVKPGAFAIQRQAFTPRQLRDRLTQFRCQLESLQHRASSHLEKLPAGMIHLPASLQIGHDDAILLSSLVAGDRTQLAHSLRVGFERTGSFHMLVVSGLHLAIFASCLLWIFGRLQIPRLTTTLLTLALLSSYALFTGFATPIARALCMIALYLIGRLFSRQRSRMNTIGFTALCMMAWSPRMLFEASFQMTLLAVVAIAGIAVPLLRPHVHFYLLALRDLSLTDLELYMDPRQTALRMRLRSMREASRTQLWPRRLVALLTPLLLRTLLRTVELVVASAVAELALALPMAIYFHRITLYALPVNIFILPLLSLLMPLAMLTLAITSLAPALGLLPAMPLALLLHAGRALVTHFGSLAGADLRTSAPTTAQIWICCLLLLLALQMAHGLPRLRYRIIAPLVMLVLAAAAVVAIWPRAIEHPAHALLFEAIDVGQGDSLLLIAPDGHTLLVDGGGFGGGPHPGAENFDIGEDVVSETLWARGIRHLDVVALSHAHSDHMGGLPAILRNFHPGALWVGSGNPPEAAYEALLAQARSLGIPLRILSAGDRTMLGPLRVDVLAPMHDYQPRALPTNNDSLVLRVAYQQSSVLLTGDAEGPVEEAMMAHEALASTVLKVGHHGSLSSTSPAFLARVAPEWAVISAGRNNRYRHPRRQILARLEQAHVKTLHTDTQGAICLLLDGHTTHPAPDCAHDIQP